ncbi:hypothetical protein CEP52_013580 [Fusarium oligoseptatum]|uniref:Uncharacterized protein n=1 Tax=Fusarium oligoseptatum TaxID=2604345 RepID=A0A428SSS7_9HYPO|nr:hypothetical protein CEP52_013580 [Fusarium oligoseptatum]
MTKKNSSHQLPFRHIMTMVFIQAQSLVWLDRQKYSRTMKVKLDSKVSAMTRVLVFEMRLFKDSSLLPLGIAVDGSNQERVMAQ